uniref:MATH domain-containing protein n=1 Tax=Heterorhabditis bacteriophora TaxID=37862 RepID=A0A1I7WXT6_HETBA
MFSKTDKSVRFRTDEYNEQTSSHCFKTVADTVQQLSWLIWVVPKASLLNGSIFDHPQKPNNAVQFTREVTAMNHKSLLSRGEHFQISHPLNPPDAVIQIPVDIIVSAQNLN